MPLHVLLESAAAVHRAFDIVSHPRVQSASFGLMDFVSSYGGAIPSDAMSVTGQFEHPLVVREGVLIAITKGLVVQERVRVTALVFQSYSHIPPIKSRLGLEMKSRRLKGRT